MAQPEQTTTAEKLLGRDAEDVLRQIKKLLNLAARNPNPAEAALAAAKANELLASYNLTMAEVEQSHGDEGKRQQEEIEGGARRWKRELWEEVADLNFCLYWAQPKYVDGKKLEYNYDKGINPSTGRYHRDYVNGRVLRVHHVLVGRQVNVAATKAMAGYLEQAIERVTRERDEKGKWGLHSRWAMSFREGMAYNLMRKIADRRDKLADEEARKKREAEDRAKASGVSTSTALTISSVRQNERDSNVDFVMGEGYSAKKREQRARAAEEARQREEAYTQWAAEHPEEAKAEEEKRQEEANKRARRYSRGGRGRDRYSNVDNGAFWAGNEAAKKVGIDPQAGSTKVAGRLK